MKQDGWAQLLAGGDLRSIGAANQVTAQVRDQAAFDHLFPLIRHPNRVVAMRAIDSAEKITVRHPEFLAAHRQELVGLMQDNPPKEIKWHLALLVPRCCADGGAPLVWNILIQWTTDAAESRIVRVNALQALYDLSTGKPDLRSALLQVVQLLQQQPVPALQARLRKLKLI